jgi:hypothetical protein
VECLSYRAPVWTVGIAVPRHSGRTGFTRRVRASHYSVDRLGAAASSSSSSSLVGCAVVAIGPAAPACKRYIGQLVPKKCPEDTEQSDGSDWFAPQKTTEVPCPKLESSLAPLGFGFTAPWLPHQVRFASLNPPQIQGKATL